MMSKLSSFVNVLGLSDHREYLMGVARPAVEILFGKAPLTTGCNKIGGPRTYRPASGGRTTSSARIGSSPNSTTPTSRPGRTGFRPTACCRSSRPTTTTASRSGVIPTSDNEFAWCWHDGDWLVTFIEDHRLRGGDFSQIKADAG